MNPILVVDVPQDATPEQAEGLLNGPGDSYFLIQVLPIATGHRAYLRRYKEKPPTKAEAVEAAKDDATALSILRANREAPIRTIVDLLKKSQIKRSKQWVSDQIDATCAEDGREEEALTYLAFFDYGPIEDAPGYLKHLLGIKRSAGWVRRKAEELKNNPERKEKLRGTLPKVKSKVELSVRK